MIVEVFNSYRHMDRIIQVHLKVDQRGSAFDFDIGAVSVLKMGFFLFRFWHYVAGSYCTPWISSAVTIFQKVHFLPLILLKYLIRFVLLTWQKENCEIVQLHNKLNDSDYLTQNWCIVLSCDPTCTTSAVLPSLLYRNTMSCTLQIKYVAEAAVVTNFVFKFFASRFLQRRRLLPDCGL